MTEYLAQDLQIKINVFIVKVWDKWRHKWRHKCFMTLRNIGYMHDLTHRSGRCWKCKIEKFQQIWIILVPKCFLCSNKENAYPHLMFLFTNKKVIGVWNFEVCCIKWMKKSEIIHKMISITSKNIGWYQSLVIDIISFHSVKIPFLFDLDMHWFHC